MVELKPRDQYSTTSLIVRHATYFTVPKGIDAVVLSNLQGNRMKVMPNRVSVRDSDRRKWR